MKIYRSKNRFIHSKSWFPRLVEGLVVEGALKKPLVEKSSIFQIGVQPNHRPEELLFVMKSVIAKQRMKGKETVIQCYDISKYFDKEMMEDEILACKERGADPVSELSVSSRKTRSDQGNSRSRLDA